MPEFKTSNATFWVIFKHCSHIKTYEVDLYSLWGHRGQKIIIFDSFRIWPPKPPRPLRPRNKFLHTSNTRPFHLFLTSVRKRKNLWNDFRMSLQFLILLMLLQETLIKVFYECWAHQMYCRKLYSQLISVPREEKAGILEV